MRIKCQQARLRHSYPDRVSKKTGMHAIEKQGSGMVEQNDIVHIQRTLVMALGIRNRMGGLLELAHEISLVSLNARVTSAQLGEAGRVFGIVTAEINDIAKSLRSTVGDIRALTQQWTEMIAQALQNARYVSVIGEAQQLCVEHLDTHQRLGSASQQSIQALESYTHGFPKLLQDLVFIIEDMEKSLKIVNYVKVAIMIESERLQAAAAIAHNAFMHLASEIQAAADKIRGMATHAMQALRAILTEEASFKLLEG